MYHADIPSFSHRLKLWILFCGFFCFFTVSNLYVAEPNLSTHSDICAENAASIIAVHAGYAYDDIVVALIHSIVVVSLIQSSFNSFGRCIKF